jgi:hypothetical protein
LLPILLQACLFRLQGEKVSLIQTFFGIGAAFLIAFLFTTPGALIEPGRFFYWLHDISHQYASGKAENQLPHTVNPGLNHLWLMSWYLSLQALSRFWFVSVFFAALALKGAWDLIRSEIKIAVVFLSFPFAYLLFFSTQRVMYVRNLLALIPFLSILAARGLSSLRDGTGGLRILGRVSSAIAVFGLILNAGWNVWAALSIQNAKRGDWFEEVPRYLRRHPDKTFLVSPSVAKKLSDLHMAEVNVTTLTANAADLAILYSGEIKWEEKKANRPDCFVRWFGPRDVNFNYYPARHLRERYVVIRADEAKDLSVFTPAIQ